MNKLIGISTLIAVIILVSLVGIRFALAQENHAPLLPMAMNSTAYFPWETQNVHSDSSLDIGDYASLALRPFDDRPYITYYDATNGDLRVAVRVNGNGNCGTNNNWYCYALDYSSGDDVGAGASIDIWGYSEDYWKIGISYVDRTHYSLKAAIATCHSSTCEWDISTITDPSGGSIIPRTSIKFNSAGSPAIAYNDGNWDNYLGYANYVSTGGDCDANTSWKCTAVHQGGGMGRYPSLDFDYADQPYIAYYDSNNATQDLLVAKYSNGSWSHSIVDALGDAGHYPSLVAPKSAGEPVRVAYYDRTNGQLKYYASAPDNLKMVVDEIGDTTNPVGISMKIDKDGLPVIAYKQLGFNNTHLRIARPYIAYDDGMFGNCGDEPPYLFLYWRCINIGGGSLHNTAEYASLAITSSDLVDVAYSDHYITIIGDHSGVKFTYQTLLKTYLPIASKH